jgi:hypothetical protein
MRGLATDCQIDRALTQHEDFFMHMLVRRVRSLARIEFGHV